MGFIRIFLEITATIYSPICFHFISSMPNTRKCLSNANESSLCRRFNSSCEEGRNDYANNTGRKQIPGSFNAKMGTVLDPTCDWLARWTRTVPNHLIHPCFAGVAHRGIQNALLCRRKFDCAIMDCWANAFYE